MPSALLLCGRLGAYGTERLGLSDAAALLSLMTHLSHTALPLTERKILSFTHIFAQLFYVHLRQLLRTNLSRTALSHISLSHTTLYNNRSSTMSFAFPAFSAPLEPLFVIIGRS